MDEVLRTDRKDRREIFTGKTEMLFSRFCDQ